MRQEARAEQAETERKLEAIEARKRQAQQDELNRRLKQAEDDARFNEAQIREAGRAARESPQGKEHEKER